jgi:adenosylhomocysteine nucleosidase
MTLFTERLNGFRPMDTHRRKIALVAALEREVWPLVKHWSASEREFDGRQFRFFENARAVLVCGGIGAEAARRATEAIIRLYQPVAVESVGFAGALDSRLEVGTVIGVKRVIDAKDGSTAEAPIGYWTLVSSESTAGVEQKKKLALAYGAHAVDMESAAVARAAQCRGIPFLALKVISDAHDFEMPPVDRFVSHDGRFRTGRFLLFALLRPWLWLRVVRLARNSNKAVKALCRWLDQYNHEVQLSELGPGLHLTTVSH